ncbi:hypothetical protein [uncultured Cellulomonas sp.]|uniref:hypothetical protein n=1 Tax=uncultured Cellulomonas sp. TaxID=189682 RepID=UPI00260F788D|nr:hypothetical protein [uncultured Cellulomonas sp.]
MTDVTYRRLLVQTAALVEEGSRSTNVRLDDRASALSMVTDRHAVLSALEAHIWALLTPGRAAGMRSALHPDPVEAAALHLAEAITATIGADRPHPSLLDGPHSAWGRSAKTLRAATDLIAVHHDAAGSPRTPVAHLLESNAVRDAGLSHVAALALTTASVEDALALRVGQTGVPWPTVRAWLPGMQDVALAARGLAQAAGPADPYALPHLGLVATRVRTGDVLVELTDRLLRVRHRAWEQMNSPERSIATLRDLATIGVAVHAHAAVFHAGPDGPAAPLIARGKSWQELSAKLAGMVSPVPRDDVVHDDLTGLARLLPAVAPLGEAGRSLQSDSDARRTGAAFGGAVVLMTEVAEYNARTFAAINRTSTVYVPARTLTGDEITDHPALVQARLDGRLAPASARQLDEVGKLYQSVRSHPSPKPTQGPVLGHAAADRMVGVEPIGLQVDA